jgi:ABC-type arginine/histidine transport system permease subunit
MRMQEIIGWLTSGLVISLLVLGIVVVLGVAWTILLGVMKASAVTQREIAKYERRND